MKFTKKIKALLVLCISIFQLDATSNHSTLQKIARTTALVTATAATTGGVGYEMGKNADLQPGKTYKVTHPDQNIARAITVEFTGKIMISSQLNNNEKWHPNNYTGIIGNNITINDKYIVTTNFFHPKAINKNTALTVETFRQSSINEKPEYPILTTITQDEQGNFVKQDNSTFNPFNLLTLTAKNSLTCEDIAFQFAEKGNAQKIHDHLNSIETKK